ncbi:CHAP domain-containing protein [Actinomadura opuntiae]|uniref:CHAP domain-containing protein n=1 Tax=Actinomadura sp. OS1-43 TaxID=604315 RepID=UPI00255B1F24|nr:CHAP domain-containing protein [Actinomadura sp. OS1-43]MDL4819866.1 CHAP domain-containing protein [Actinomadura sp. OS1-43]
MAGKHRKASPTSTTPISTAPTSTAPVSTAPVSAAPTGVITAVAPIAPIAPVGPPPGPASGRHRKPGRAAIAWRTTGGVIVGAAVVGTVAATAQASVLPFGDPAAAKPAAAADMAAARAPQNHAAADAKAGGGKAAKAAPRRTARSAPKAAAAKERSKKSRPTARAAIELARSQVGESPDGDGDTKFGDWYEGTERARETVARDGGSVQEYSDAEWCDMFISWVGDRLGFTDQIGSDAWTVAHAQWFQDNGRWGDAPKPGAIVFFSWGGGKSNDDIQHVGMVVKDNEDGTIQTVEGNTGNSVQVKERSTDDVVGYGYPDYAK